MKPRSKSLLSIGKSLLISVFLAQGLIAQAATVDTNEKLTGNDLSVENAVRTSDAIFRGHLIEIGAPVLKGIGENFYGVKVNVLESYLGNIGSYESDFGNVLVSLLVLPRSGNEQPPVVEHLYIFFVQKKTNLNLSVLKILPATDENIAAVNKLIIAGPDQTLPPVAQLNEIDVNFIGRGVLYFIRIGPNGSASLAFASQYIGSCPPKTFDFEQLYKELSTLPDVTNPTSQYMWGASFLWRNGQKRDPSGKTIADPKIILKILEKFVKNQTGKEKEYLVKRFSESPALPPEENGVLIGS